MLVCSNCNQEQDSGKFCESCGSPLQVQVTQADTTANSTPNLNHSSNVTNPVNEPPLKQTQESATTEQAQPNNETTEAVKETLTNYWTYFINLLKNPTNAFSLNESQLINGLITIGLFVVLFPLGAYFFFNGMMKDNLFGIGLPFSTNIRFMLLLIIMLAIIFFSAFAMIKAGKHQGSLKLLLTQFGGLLAPATLLHVISLLGGLVKAPTLIFFPLILSLAYTVSYVPVFMVYEKLSEVNPRGQKVYFSFITIIIMSIAFYIFTEAMLTNFISDFENIIDAPYFW